MKRFKFSLKTTLVCIILAGLMIRAAIWQASRYEQKQVLITELTARLKIPIEKLNPQLENIKKEPEKFTHRRFEISGEFDFENEILLKNRRHNDIPGYFIITPLKLDNAKDYILVSRGFIPKKLAALDKRKQFQKNKNVSFTGLAKASVNQKFFLAPEDKFPATGKLTEWLRVDIGKIEKQLSYKLLPLYFEVMEFEKTTVDTINKIVKSDSDKSDMLLLPLRGKTLHQEAQENYPVVVYDTYIPPGRHYAYIYEWSIMAAMTLLIGLILQFRR